MESQFERWDFFLLRLGGQKSVQKFVDLHNKSNERESVGHYVIENLRVDPTFLFSRMNYRVF